MQLERRLQERFRRRRSQLFNSLLDTTTGQIALLDVGGSPNYWRQVGTLHPRILVTFLNLEAAHLEGPATDQAIIGDARAMPFADKSFDVVFSNSVIEHVGGYDDQRRMAGEVRRVGKRYFVQAPNRHFPVEPHFLFPMFQFLPLAIQVHLLSRFRLGWTKMKYTPASAREAVGGIRLVTKAEMKELFPGAQIHHERILGFTKSFTAYDGWI